MNIEIPNDDYERIAGLASTAGYEDVGAFVVALANSCIDPRGPLTDDELQASVARLNAANAAIDRGEWIDAHAAFQQIADEFGFDLQV